MFAEAHSFTGGLYQAVSVPRGATVTFAAWGYATAEGADSITEMRIGVNPGGGFNPLADNVVWSEPVDASEGYVQFEVTAVAQSDRVTVFTWTHPGACAANSAYWDGAELTVEP
ncbi:MAG: hypothetical protein M5R40_23010 [Anaerolineae bacterium]|nr:hypothetical protein [Anaerolineae bacterium]